MSGKSALDSLNVKKRCAASGVGLWQCPHFLFIIMGLVIITAILATDIVARNYAEPEIAALIVLVISAFLFVMGHVVIKSFENVVEASRLKSEFVSIVSHELRSPLSAIKWSLDLLKTGTPAEKTSDESDSIVSSIKEQNEKMIHIVNNLLEVRRVEEKTLDFDLQKVDLKELTRDIAGKLDSYARASNLKIVLDFKNEAVILADPKKISFVITNLLENALHYSPAGGEVEIEIFEKSERIFWRITDRGSGVPAEERKNIFEKFFRSHNIYRYRSGGLGIGLFLSKAFVEAEGGKIGFLPGDKQGSVFWFVFPKFKNSGA
ncbi:MAG: HAMP domain-containing histidine kinase [Candidatus Niyogibacteria bacterium]|nr:HAMP domain-containing histidine kinase [Candidatus Niyogibacteria bacterium]